MPSEMFHKHYSLQVQLPKIVPAYFGGDWSGEVIPGYNREGERWNGWAMPLFTKAAAQAVASQIDDLRYNPQNDSFDIEVNDELDQFKGHEVDVPGVGLVKLYAIGAGSWCWDHYASLKHVGDRRVADVQSLKSTVLVFSGRLKRQSW